MRTPSSGLPALRLTPRVLPSITAPSPTTSKLGELAILLFCLQLLNLGNPTDLAGRSVAIGDGVTLAPSPDRALRTSAVSATIPGGTGVSSMLSVLDGEPAKRSRLAKAVTRATADEPHFVAAHREAQLHLDEFVAAVDGPG